MDRNARRAVIPDVPACRLDHTIDPRLGTTIGLMSLFSVEGTFIPGINAGSFRSLAPPAQPPKKAVEWSGVAGVFYCHSPDGLRRHAPSEDMRASGGIRHENSSQQDPGERRSVRRQRAGRYTRAE